MQIRMVRAKDQHKDFEPTRAESHKVYAKYQQAIHKEKPEECTEDQVTKDVL